MECCNSKKKKNLNRTHYINNTCNENNTNAPKTGLIFTWIFVLGLDVTWAYVCVCVCVIVSMLQPWEAVSAGNRKHKHTTEGHVTARGQGERVMRAWASDWVHQVFQNVKASLWFGSLCSEDGCGSVVDERQDHAEKHIRDDETHTHATHLPVHI